MRGCWPGRMSDDRYARLTAFEGSAIARGELPARPWRHYLHRVAAICDTVGAFAPSLGTAPGGASAATPRRRSGGPLHGVRRDQDLPHRRGPTTSARRPSPTTSAVGRRRGPFDHAADGQPGKTPPPNWASRSTPGPRRASALTRDLSYTAAVPGGAAAAVAPVGPVAHGADCGGAAPRRRSAAVGYKPARVGPRSARLRLVRLHKRSARRLSRRRRAASPT